MNYQEIHRKKLDANTEKLFNVEKMLENNKNLN